MKHIDLRDDMGRFRAGNIPWTASRGHSEETKTKLRKIRKAMNRKGEKNGNWSGGRYVDSRNGYVHIRCSEEGCYKLEHRLVAGKALGRPLKRNECVHHINGIKDDNRNENLLICTMNYHDWLESHMAHLYKEEHFQNDN